MVLWPSQIVWKIEYPIENLKKDRIYSALDHLFEKKDDIEHAIVSALRPDMKKVYYDLTITWAESQRLKSRWMNVKLL